jgi:hypothetical protein
VFAFEASVTRARLNPVGAAGKNYSEIAGRLRSVPIDGHRQGPARAEMIHRTLHKLPHL